MSTTTPVAATEPGAFARWARQWIIVPRQSTAARLTLVALALALQNLLELPRDPVTHALGTTLTGVLVFLTLAASLVLLLAAVGVHPPRWRWPYRRQVQIAALCLTLLVVPLGIFQSVRVVVASFSTPQYANDGTTLDHYAAQQLLDGHNPYVTSDIVAAMRALHQDPANITPLRQGAFANTPPTDYPSKDELRAVFARQPVGAPDAVQSFESRVSYPALAFLPLVPFVWAGLPSVVLFFALCLLALAILLIRSVPPDCRVWLALLVLADTPLLNAALVGDLDIFYVLLLFIAWRWWRRPLVSTVAFGLALAAKQLAWFFAPFYLLLVWRRSGARAAVRRLVGCVAIFRGYQRAIRRQQSWGVGARCACAAARPDVPARQRTGPPLARGRSAAGSGARLSRAGGTGNRRLSPHLLAHATARYGPWIRACSDAAVVRLAQSHDLFLFRHAARSGARTRR